MTRKNWSKEELIIAFNLYCKTPFGKIHIRNPEIISLAKAIGRTPSALSWKLANFARLDPTLKKRNISGATHGSKEEIAVWDEFSSDWERLSFESENLLSKITGKGLEETFLDNEWIGEGKEREAMVRVRVNQGFFRAAVLAAYNNKCCVTSLEIVELLTASHIIPWSVDITNRVNPQNGLCLNAIHDRAFDRGLITITPDYQIKISPKVKPRATNEASRIFLLSYDGVKMTMPKRFKPNPDFLRYHNENIFIS